MLCWFSHLTYIESVGGFVAVFALSWRSWWYYDVTGPRIIDYYDTTNVHPVWDKLRQLQDDILSHKRLVARGRIFFLKGNSHFTSFKLLTLQDFFFFYPLCIIYLLPFSFIIYFYSNFFPTPFFPLSSFPFPFLIFFISFLLLVCICQEVYVANFISNTSPEWPCSFGFLDPSPS